MPQTQDHTINRSAKVTNPSPIRDTSTVRSVTTKEASRKSRRHELRVASSTKPTRQSESSTEMIRPTQLSGTPSFVRTVRFKTVLEFFHISNLSNATVDESIFLHILYSQLATQAEMLAAVLPWSLKRPLRALFKAMMDPRIDDGAMIETMKSIPDPDTTPAEKMQNFKVGLRQVLTCSKEQLRTAQEFEQKAKEGKPKRGPKPKTSARVSSDKD